MGGVNITPRGFKNMGCLWTFSSDETIRKIPLGNGKLHPRNISYLDPDIQTRRITGIRALKKQTPKNGVLGRLRHIRNGVELVPPAQVVCWFTWDRSRFKKLVRTTTRCRATRSRSLSLEAIHALVIASKDGIVEQWIMT